MILVFEVEIKAKIENFDSLKEKLNQLGAVQKNIIKMEDIYFKHPSRDFAMTDEALRIRKTDDTKILTYKGPKLDEITKTRKEIEMEITDQKKLKSILIKLGFIEVPKIKKKRVIYELDDYSICLDEVDFIGKYIEIESEVAIEEDRIKKTEELINFAEQLGIDKESFIRKSYLELIKEKVKDYI